ncbi:SDR family NAD(P)-dependent oxidoreductase [Candidatus Nitrospira neomarina]|uniref:SDR family NAD(P)-dependent oxidoreductase n=1 Tax=Candidatus Nitrospira neomarina TaxID=3020899 RepID=A0AA96GQQ4_9BACT|nr:SDR family NAD(P)-dependent oxidoreductase [Candidatus Nitrospira neomarina]WNM61826.1 SDR family NAD(P)-dependent oxidoreductase [Candidatus Nitrospira neomarina]
MGDIHSLQGQVALVTGGGVGIGRAIAQAFVGQQAGVAICGRRVEELERTAADLIQAGGEVLSVLCDVTQRVDVERTMKRVIQNFVGWTFLLITQEHQVKRRSMIRMSPSGRIFFR